MSERRSIGPVDTMWLNRDQPNNLMVIDGVMWFDETIDIERLRPVIQRRLLDRYPVFSQRPVPPSTPFGMPHWEDDPDFDLNRHLKRATLPAPGDQVALQDFVESRMSVPFDRAHPLWEFFLVDGYLGGCALVSRFHHSLADGMALSQVLLSLTDASPTVDLEELDEFEESESSSQQNGGVVGAARAVLGTGAQTVRGGLRAISSLLFPSWPTRPGRGTCWSSAGEQVRFWTRCCWATTRRTCSPRGSRGRQACGLVRAAHDQGRQAREPDHRGDRQ